jgi:TP901 family phage tail tape measure protein
MDLARLILGVDTRGLRDGERDLNSFSNTARGVAGAVGAAFAAIGVSMGVESLVRTNAEFGKSMSQVAAISGATGAELEKLRQTALQMGADTSFSASQAADALGLLAQAGFSASEAIEAVPQVLALASAGALDLATAADIASNVMNGFRLSTADAGRIADVLAQSAASTNASVQQMGQSMATAAPIAAALGISLEETAAAIGVLSDAGLQGEVAGTSLRGVFASLAQPTNEAREALAKYGLTAKEIDPQTVGISRAMATLAENGLTTADAFVIFGREAASGALVMAESADRMRTLTGEFENAKGAAEEMAATMRDNLAGDLDALSGSVETMIIRMGDGGLTGSFRSMAQAATSSINAITANMQMLSSVVMTVGGAWAAYRVTLLAVAGVQAAYTSAMIVATRVIGGVQAATLGLNAALAANPFGAVAVAVGVLTGAFIALANSQEQARAKTNNLIASLKSLAEARSAEFTGSLIQARRQLKEEEKRLAELEVQARPGNRMTRGGIEGPSPGAVKAVEEQRKRVKSLNREIMDSMVAYGEAEKAAQSIVVPTASATAATVNLGKALGDTGGTASRAADDFQRLYDRLHPFEAAMRQLTADEMLIMSRKNLTDAEKDYLIALRRSEEFRKRTAGLGDATVSASVSRDEPLVDIDKAARDYIDTVNDMEGRTKSVTQGIAESFGQMADRTLQALDRLTGAIRGGGFLDILGGVINLGIQLGGMGAFGSSIQARITAPPGRANGGLVSSGRSYLVGERGPELFTPGATGFITPRAGNDNTRISVDASPYFDVRVNGQIVQASPAIMQGGANVAAKQMGRAQSRRVPG